MGGPDDELVDWFRHEHRSIRGVERALWRLHDQLDGGLTAGQSSSSDTWVAFSLKYEFKDGVLSEIAVFRETALGGEWVDRHTGLVEARDAIGEALDFLSENISEAWRSQYRDAELVIRAKRLLRGAATALSIAVDRCVELLIEATAEGSSPEVRR